MLADRALSDAIYAVGAHYPGVFQKDDKVDDRFKASPEAAKTGKPLWSSEEGPWRGDWNGASTLARIYNRNYIVGKI